MVQLYNDTARLQGYSKDRMHAIRGDLLAPSDDFSNSLKTFEFSDFDIIVMSMALHHVASPQLMLTKLAALLKPGGSLLIIDWAHPDENVEEIWPSPEDFEKMMMKDPKHTLNNATFSKENVVGLLKAAGCSNAEYQLCDEVSKLPAELGGERRLFFGLGRK